MRFLTIFIATNQRKINSVSLVFVARVGGSGAGCMVRAKRSRRKLDENFKRLDENSTRMEASRRELVENAMNSRQNIGCVYRFFIARVMKNIASREEKSNIFIAFATLLSRDALEANAMNCIYFYSMRIHRRDRDAELEPHL